MGNCLLNSLRLSINRRGGSSPLRFVERQDERRWSRDPPWRKRSASSSKLLKICKQRRSVLEIALIRHHLGLSWLLRVLPKKIRCSKWLLFSRARSGVGEVGEGAMRSRKPKNFPVLPDSRSLASSLPLDLVRVDTERRCALLHRLRPGSRQHNCMY